MISCQWLNGWSFTVIGYSFIFIFLKQVCLNCIIFDCHISDYKATYFFVLICEKNQIQELKPKTKGNQQYRGAWLPAWPWNSLCGARQPLTMGCTSCCDPARLLTKLLAAHQFYFLCVCVCSLNIFGKGENIYPQMHIIISGLLGYIIRVSKAWILFSLLLTTFSKCNSKANWPCVLLEASKCPTRCPWHISSLNSTC